MPTRSSSSAWRAGSPAPTAPKNSGRTCAAGLTSISEVPPDRWDNDLFYDENPAVPGKVNTKWAGFVDGISLFDAHLFGISPYEAPEIDPQQRLLMETSWRLIENAGWTKARLAKTATGVFVGISTNDYLYSKIKLTPGMATFNAYSGLGNANSIAANRLSYFYDLRGPSVAVDTACSSSLTAFHLGAQAILSGECDQAIVGGVNAILSPGPTITLCQFGMMAPDGRCKTFDARADGYVRAEGCGLVLLKRRSAALADGDRILAVLDASVTGQDGASPGITFPNGAAQDELIARALARAGLDGAEVSYLEAHGTGTAVGDPVEVEQLRAHYGDGPAASCALGSVKANIGHLEAAAGIASVIKVLLMLEHRKIPPQIHVEMLNPKLAIDGTRLHVPRALADWTAEGRRRAAISSFGFGGSLAHVILAEPAEGDRPPRPKPDFAGEHAFPLTISAPSAEALKVQLRTMSDWLNSFPQISYRDICRTQAAGRSHLRYRSAVLSTSRKGAAEKIDRWLQADHEEQPAAETVATCFLFTGQGEHYLHMGREMYERFPVFRAAFDRCAAAIDGPGRLFTLADLAFRIEDTRHWSDLYMQPILFAVQYALGTLFRACGVVPATVIGHSLGEYAAACLAGCLTPEDAMRILHRRAELIQSLDRVGAMAVVFAPRDAVEAELDGAQAQVAAVNSPGKTVISGHGTEVDRVRELFEARGVESYYLKTTQAFHSHYLDPVLDDFRRELAGHSFSAPDLPWISTLTGEPMTAAPDADYWTRHMREPVLFSRAVAGVGADAFVEVGPGASAVAGARETLGRKNALYLRTLNPKKGERTESYFFLDAIGQLYTRGAAIRWDPILPGTAQPDRVPGLTFLRRPYWMKGVTAEDLNAFAAPGAGAAAKTPQVAEQGWHYTLEWREIGPVAGPQAGIPRAHNWLVVASPGPLVEALRAEARDRGDDLFWLNTDPRGGWPGSKPAAAVAPGADAGAWAKALGRIFNLKSRVGVTAWKILFVTGPPLPPADLDRAQARDFGQLIPMLQALRQLAAVSPAWLVTEDAQAPEGADASNLGDAAVWGFGKTLFLEHPEWRGGMIDLTAADDPAGKARNVVRKVLAPQFESCVALRGDRQFVQQIAPAPLPPARSAAFRGDGAYIVTGGLGGLGLATAEWIVAKGGRRLILLSRRAFPDRTRWHGLAETDPAFAAVGKIRALEEAGAGVEVRALDIRDTDALAALFAELDRDGVPVRGVVHAAGENWFGKVMTLDVPRFLETLRTKTSATWALHRLTADRDLDCFILFSSVSAVWGSVELSHYTAANQVMDILDRRRAAQGLPSLCVDWGPWAEVGMSAMPEERAVLQKLGFSLMPPGRAIAAMETALAADRPLSLIADIDWEKFQVFIDFCLQPSMFADVAIGQERRDLARPGKLDAILSSPPDKAREMIEKVVRMELRSVTLIESTDTIDADQRFNFMGLDSLMALSFAAALESYFRFEVPSTLAYNYPTIRAVTDYLLTELIGAAPGPAAPVPAEPPAAPGWLRPLNDSPGAPTLCCLPYAGSGVSAFRGLAAALAGQVQVTGVQIPGREDHDHVPAFCRMQALIPELVEAARRIGRIRALRSQHGRSNRLRTGAGAAGPWAPAAQGANRIGVEPAGGQARAACPRTAARRFRGRSSEHLRRRQGRRGAGACIAEEPGPSARGPGAVRDLPALGRTAEHPRRRDPFPRRPACRPGGDARLGRADRRRFPTAKHRRRARHCDRAARGPGKVPEQGDESDRVSTPAGHGSGKSEALVQPVRRSLRRQSALLLPPRGPALGARAGGQLAGHARRAGGADGGTSGKAAALLHQQVDVLPAAALEDDGALLLARHDARQLPEMPRDRADPALDPRSDLMLAERAGARVQHQPASG